MDRDAPACLHLELLFLHGLLQEELHVLHLHASVLEAHLHLGGGAGEAPDTGQVN